MKRIALVFSVLVMMILVLVACKNPPAVTETIDNTGVPVTTETLTETRVPVVPPTVKPTTQPTVAPTVTTVTPPTAGNTDIPSTTPTPTPTETKPVEPPVVVPGVTSGQFTSDTGTYLNLMCNWKVDKNSEDKYILKVDISLVHYSLYVAKREANYTIGGTAGSFDTPAIRIDPEAGKQNTYLSTVTYELSENDIKNGVSFNVSWTFNGTYSGVAIKDVVASQLIVFN